jgi:hypothetical protein
MRVVFVRENQDEINLLLLTPDFGQRVGGVERLTPLHVPGY